MKSTKLAVLLMSIAIAAIPPMFTSCSSGDEEEWNSPNDDWDNENNGNSDPTYELVKKNISASVSYGDYSWNISIKSKLSSALPGKYIVYGVESGYGDYQYYEHFKFNNSYTQKNDGNGNMTISYPTFVGNEYASRGLYWSSYKALKEKKDNGEKLNSDEQDLWNDIVKYMKAKESKAKSSFAVDYMHNLTIKDTYFTHLGKNPRLAQTMMTEIPMVEIQVGAALVVLLHTRSRT